MYEDENTNFASRAVFVEMRLRQALAASSEIGSPNVFRCGMLLVSPVRTHIERGLRIGLYCKQMQYADACSKHVSQCCA